jgi:hypothetical protein
MIHFMTSPTFASSRGALNFLASEMPHLNRGNITNPLLNPEKVVESFSVPALCRGLPLSLQSGFSPSA